MGLSKQIIKASKNTIIQKIINPRIWLVAGSGGIVMSLSKAFPNAKLFIYLTDGEKHLNKVTEWTKKNKNITIINDYILDEINDYDKFYKSVHNYYSKIWPYVKQYGLDGDILWNVASD